MRVIERIAIVAYACTLIVNLTVLDPKGDWAR